MNGISALIRLVLDKVSAKKVADDLSKTVAEGGKTGGAEFSKTLTDSVARRLGTGGYAKKLGDAGVQMAKTLRQAFDREMADIRVARSQNLISDREAARQGVEAAKHYKAAVLRQLDRPDLSNQGAAKLFGTLRHAETEGRKAGETYAKSVGTGVKKWAAGVVASIAALFAVRHIIGFVKESVGAFMESNRASEAMRESAKQASEAWTDFKASVGNAVVTMLGGEAGVDTLSDRMRELTRWVDDNRETWRIWGQNVSSFLSWMVADLRATVRDIETLGRAWDKVLKATDQAASMPGAMGGVFRLFGARKRLGSTDAPEAPGSGGTPGARERIAPGVLSAIRAEDDLNKLLARQVALRQQLNDERSKANPVKARVESLTLELSEVGNRIEVLRQVGQGARNAESAARKAAADARRAAADAERAQKQADEAATRRMQAEDRRFNAGPKFENTLEIGRGLPAIRTGRTGATAIVEAMDAQQAKARETAEVWREAHRDMEDTTKNVAAGIVDSFGSAIEMMVTGAGTIGDAFVGIGAGIAADILGGIKQMALGKAAENIAWAFEKFAHGNVPQGVGFLAAAAKWTAAGGLAAGIGGAMGGIGRGGSVHRGAGTYGRETAANTQPQNITYIYLDPFDPRNPVHSRQIGKAVDLHVELAGRPDWARKGPNP